MLNWLRVQSRESDDQEGGCGRSSASQVWKTVRKAEGVRLGTYPCHEVESVYGLSPKNTIRNSGKSSSVNGRFSPVAAAFRSIDELRFSERGRELERLNPDGLVGLVLDMVS